jgi:hypothetical protein
LINDKEGMKGDKRWEGGRRARGRAGGRREEAVLIF